MKPRARNERKIHTPWRYIWYKALNKKYLTYPPANSKNAHTTRFKLKQHVRHITHKLNIFRCLSPFNFLLGYSDLLLLSVCLHIFESLLLSMYYEDLTNLDGPDFMHLTAAFNCRCRFLHAFNLSFKVFTSLVARTFREALSLMRMTIQLMMFLALKT